MNFPHGLTVTFTEPLQVEDRYGDLVDTWDGALGVPIDGCAVWTTLTTELDEAGRTKGTEYLTLAIPVGVEVTKRARATVNGLTYAVRAKPIGWTSPFTGTAFGSIVNVERQEG